MAIAEQFSGDTDSIKREIEQSYDSGDDAVTGSDGAEAGTIDSPYCIGSTE